MVGYDKRFWRVYFFGGGMSVWVCFAGSFVVWRVFLVYFGFSLLLNSPWVATELLGGWFPGVILVPSGVWRVFHGWMFCPVLFSILQS